MSLFFTLQSIIEDQIIFEIFDVIYYSRWTNGDFPSTFSINHYGYIKLDISLKLFRNGNIIHNAFT